MELEYDNEYKYDDGWPGVYWIEKTIDTHDIGFAAYQRFECCHYSKQSEITNTCAIVRAFNWWSDLYIELSDTVIFKKG